MEVAQQKVAEEAYQVAHLHQGEASRIASHPSQPS